MNKHKKSTLGIALITLLVFFLANIGAAPSAAPSKNKGGKNTTPSISSQADIEAVANAKSALSAAGRFYPVESVDSNLVTMAQAIVDAAVAGVKVSVSGTANSQVALSGAITYGPSEVAGSVTLMLAKNGASGTLVVEVEVPAQVLQLILEPVPDPAVSDAEQVAAAENALATCGCFQPTEGIDTNLVTMAQAIVDEVASGVTVSIYKSSNSQVATSGAITYGSTSVTGLITFVVTKNQEFTGQDQMVTVPAHFVSTPAVSDADLIAAAKTALSTAGTLKPVEGFDTNIIPMAQAIVNAAVSGVTVSISSTANSQVSSSGVITYGSSAVTGSVTFKISKGSASATQAISVAVPAKALPLTSTVTDADLVTAGKTALADVGILKPIENIDTNVIDMAQVIVNSAVSGVTVSISSTANSQVSSSGVITYGSSAVAGSVTFKISKGSVSATQSLSVAVPAKTVVAGISVKTYGTAKGDGVTDDTAAIQKTIDYASSLGGGTVYFPDGTYLINPDTQVKLRNNVKLNLANSTIKARASSKSAYNMLAVIDVANVEIYGGTLIGERYIHTGTGGEWGMGINISGSNNVYVHDINVQDCWGDGMYVANGSQGYSDTVTIENFTIKNCRRQGISVISAKNLIVRDGQIYNTNGTPPQDGIDIEPNVNTDWMQNLLFENVQTYNNQGFGIAMTFWFYSGSVNPVNVTFKNCVDSGSLRNDDFGIGSKPFVENYVPSSICKVTII